MNESLKLRIHELYSYQDGSKRKTQIKITNKTVYQIITPNKIAGNTNE